MVKFADTYSFKLKSLQELSSIEWHEIMKLRSDVFVVEQICVYPDPDEEDRSALHLVVEEDGKICGYLRILNKDAWHLGRILVPESFRGKGLGNQLVEVAVDHCRKEDASKAIQMSTQVYLTDFYARHGFEAQGSMYLEDGIPHLKMVYQEPLK